MAFQPRAGDTRLCEQAIEKLTLGMPVLKGTTFVHALTDVQEFMKGLDCQPFASKAPLSQERLFDAVVSSHQDTS